MWNHVGRPSMFEGKTFLPLQGMPMWCNARRRTRLADWLPDPLTVPTRIVRSLTEACDGDSPTRAVDVSTTLSVVGDMSCCASKGRSAAAAVLPHPLGCTVGLGRPAPPA